MDTKSIKNWSVDDRPREKLLLNGIDSLSNSELLAIVINNGTQQNSAVDVCKNLLAAVNNDLQQLGKLTVQDIKQLQIKGIGQAKAISILAALELGNRRAAAVSKKQKVVSSADVALHLKAQLQYKLHEMFVVVFLNKNNIILHTEIISKGGITGTVADPRIILRKALEHHATSIILSHNHPSGNLKPSSQDEIITQKIKQAATYFDIAVLDHIIVSDEGYFSFADEGIL